MKSVVVVGAQWGDEGKGKVVDYLAGSFDNYIWRFVDGKPKQNAWPAHKKVPASTRESHTLSKDLQKRGFRFVGSTICYALMQATGMVNDHNVTCFRHAELSKLK